MHRPQDLGSCKDDSIWKFLQEQCLSSQILLTFYFCLKGREKAERNGNFPSTGLHPHVCDCGAVLCPVVVGVGAGTPGTKHGGQSPHIQECAHSRPKGAGTQAQAPWCRLQAGAPSSPPQMSGLQSHPGSHSMHLLVKNKTRMHVDGWAAGTGPVHPSLWILLSPTPGFQANNSQETTGGMICCPPGLLPALPSGSCCT